MRYQASQRNGTVDTEVIIGGSGVCYSRGSDVVVPGCGTPKRPLCDVSRIGARLTPILGQAIWTLTLAPTRTNYYHVMAFVNHVTDTANPDANHRLEIQTVEINQQPQEPFSGVSALANTSSILTDDYETPPAGSGTNSTGAVPVAWGIISQAALINVLTIGGVSRYAANVSCDYYAAGFGNGLDVLPPGYVIGKPFIQVA